jgi:transposase
MSRRAAARRYEISESSTVKWLERIERDGSREPVGHGGPRPYKLMPQRDFLEAAGPRSLTPSFRRFAFAFCPSEASKPPPRLMGRFFRRIGVTFKKRPSSRASRIARTSAATANDGELSGPYRSQARRFRHLLNRSPRALPGALALRADCSLLGPQGHEERWRLDSLRQVRAHAGPGATRGVQSALSRRLRLGSRRA